MIISFKAKGTSFGLEFDLELEKDKQVYCFIGENGVGKTKLLETLCLTILYGHGLFNSNHKLSKSIFKMVKVWDNLNKLNMSVPRNIELNNSLIVNKEYDQEDIEHIIDKSKNPNKFEMPFCYISAKDRGYGLNSDTNNIKLLGHKLDEFVKDFLKTYNNLNNIENDKRSIADWFVTRIISNNSLVANGDKSFNEVIFLCKILQELEQENFKNLIKDKNLEVYINNGQLYFNHIPFQYLSTGYMAIIKIVQDIINTYSAWDFDNTNSFDRKAVFFIDELEAHLHPKWESKFIPLLKKYFPKATFFVATHSPVIISSTEEGEAYELVKNNNVVSAKKLGNPKNWYLEDVLQQAFHLKDLYFEKEDEHEKTRTNFQEFSELVKSYMNSKDEILKPQATKLYDEILSSLSEDDPRKITLNNLYSLLK